MMREISRGKGSFPVNEFDYENLYFEALHGDKVYAYCHVQIIPGVAYIHLYVQKWGKSVLKEMRADFDALKAEFRARGIWRVLGTHPVDGSGKWCRFIKLLGFDKIIGAVMPEGEPCKLAMMEV